MKKAKVIFDFGSNNGDDLPYYLKKADRVVAVEANPVLCDQIRGRFSEEINSGRLVVECKVLAVGELATEVKFYIHKTNHVLSQFPAPIDTESFDEILLPSISPLKLIEQYGEPYYIKIDIEHYDETVLRALFGAGIYPPFISAEAHSVEVFAILLAMGNYNAFKLVDGPSVQSVYANCTIDGLDGTESYSFPYHSAGPFGDDVNGPWLCASDMMKTLALEGTGWKDIHASSVRAADSTLHWNRRNLTALLLRKETSQLKRRLFSGFRRLSMRQRSASKEVEHEPTAGS